MCVADFTGYIYDLVTKDRQNSLADAFIHTVQEMWFITSGQQWQRVQLVGASLGTSRSQELGLACTQVYNQQENINNTQS